MASDFKILSGKYKGTHLYTLEGINTRPTTGRVLENLFNILCHNQWISLPFHKLHLLDLCAGSGRISIEALSRGVFNTVMIENNKEAQVIIRRNMSKLKLSQDILGYDVTNLPICPYKEQFSLVICDAPYKTDIAEKAILSAYQQNWLCKEAIIIIETEKSRENFEFPFLSFIQRRNYGQSSLHFFIRK